ncbi:hypothetical protein ACJ41O_014648 [Fusarium nematophilum]
MLYPLSLLLWVLPGAYGCSTTTFNSTYGSYPDCAASCLACEDASYSTNFANNCDYASGECCTSSYHTSIAETWDCVRTKCGEKLSLEAFDTFVDFCEEMDTPLKGKDIPEGYDSKDKDSESESGDNTSGGSGLSKGQIIGISIGGATFVVGIIGLIFKCYQCHRKRRQGMQGGETPSDENRNGHALIHQPQHMELGALTHAFRGDGDVTVSHTRNTSTTSLFGQGTRTTDTWEIKRARGDGGGFSQTHTTNRIVEELD